MKRKAGMLLLAVGLAASIRAAQVYPVPEGERIYPDYAVKVDGEKVSVSEVRCSAMPFNRRWPGHQRQVEQTELCGMARFAFSGKATVTVTAAKDFRTVKIRPLSRNVAFHRKGRTVTFDISRPGGYSVEFDGYHNNLHVFADAKESDGPRETKSASPGLYFGPGTHDIGIRWLKNGDTVRLDPGAVVYGGFHASNATDIAILGRGIIDMSRIKEKILFPATGDGHEAVKNAKRWHMIDMRNCRNVRISGVTLRDSLCYNIAMWGCEDVDVSNVKIIGQWRFNTDGIDLHNCRRARVSDCFARTYDDTFCFKAHEGYGNCEDCTFERCVAWNDWGKAFEVGVECRAEHLRRLAFRDCDCIHAVSWAMDVSNVDYGRVSDVLFDDIRIEQDDPMPRSQLQEKDESPFDATKGLDAPPRLFQALVSFHHEYSKENGGKWSGGGFIDGMTVRNLRVTTDGRKPLVRCGAIDEKHRPENIVFEDMTINGRPVPNARSVELEVGKDAVAPKFVLSDARRMDATEMNPGSTLGCRERSAGGAFKVLIYGNSIALHGRAPKIGWHGDWGMAASAREKDFAHLVVAGLEAKRGARADFRIRNLALLERNFRTNLTHFADLASDVAYAPDYVVIAIGENVSALGEKDMPDYTRFLVALTQPLVASAKRPKVVMRSPFWRNPAKADCTAKAAAQTGAIYVDVGYLGDQEENMALGLFEHKGVAKHPGDLGMRRLADLVLSGLDKAVCFDQAELCRKDAAEWIAGAYVPPAESDTAAFFEPAQNDVVERAFQTRDVAVTRAVWRVAAPGMRDLFVNGERISPTALPPLTPYRKRILEESFDVTAHVRKGTRNLLRVELGNGWYNPLPLKMWYVYNLRDHLAIGTPCVKATLEIAYADGVRETVATDGSWRAQQGRVVHNNIYLGVVEDRRLAMDIGEKARVVKGPPGKVVAAGAFPKTVVYDRWTAQRVTQLSNDVWLVDMGVNAAGTLRARLRGVPRGGKVRLRQGERVWPDGTVNVMTAVAGQIKDPKRGPLFAIAEQRDSVIGDGSPEFTFEPRFTFHVFRYVQVEGPCAAPRPEDFEMCAWSADVKDRSHFTCSNEKLNRLHEVCRRTFRSNLQSVQSDCPGREKFGYGGDIACTVDAFWLNYDMAEFYRKTLRDFLDEAEDDGLFTETAPFVGIASKSVYPTVRQTPNAMIAKGGTRAGPIGWAVGVPVLVDSLVRYDGDLESARLAYPALVRYIDLVAKRYPSNDLPECLGDHVAVVGEKHYWKLTSLVHWHQFVTLTEKFAQLLGKSDDAARLRELAGQIAAKFRADYVHDGGKVGSGLQGEQLFALYHGLLEPKDVPAAYELLKKDIHAQGDALTTGIFGTKYLLEYLPLHGDAALAARVAMHEGFPGWFNMLDCGATTLWQNWSEEKCKSVSSNCHPMFGSVDEWLIRHVLGISVCEDAVGCDKVRIAPQPIPGVTSASGWLDTPKGRISVSWKITDGKIDIKSDIPDGIKTVN